MFVSMAEGFLGLTEDEKSKVEPALPYLKELLDALNPEWDAVQKGIDLLCKGKPVFDRLITDMRVLGPAVSTILGDGMPDMFGAMGAAKDATNTLDVNKAWTGALKADGQKFAYLAAKCQELGPKVLPALQILIAAAKRKGVV